MRVIRISVTFLRKKSYTFYVLQFHKGLDGIGRKGAYELEWGLLGGIEGTNIDLDK